MGWSYFCKRKESFLTQGVIVTHGWFYILVKC